MDNRIYIGIDPGKNGGIGFIYNDIAYCRKCPTTVSDMTEEIKVVMEMAPDIQKFAIIEDVHSMPGQGVRSVFTFGKGYGQWIGILSALSIPYTQVSPQKWMKFYTPLPKDKKERKNKKILISITLKCLGLMKMIIKMMTEEGALDLTSCACLKDIAKWIEVITLE